MSLEPFVLSDSSARVVCCIVVIVLIVFIWARASGRAFALQAHAAARRFLVFACLMLAASLPADVLLTKDAASYLEALRVTVRARGGTIAFEETPLSAPVYRVLAMGFGLPSQSLLLRSKSSDGIVLPPKDSTEPQPFPPSQPPDLGPYFWRD